MYLIRLFEVAGHLGKEFAFSDTHIDCETKLIPDLILDRVSQCNRVWVDAMGAAEVRETFVNTDLLYHRSDLLHDRDECSRGGLIEFEIRPGQE